MSDREMFEETLSESLEFIDENLGTADLPVTQRPLHAAMLFAEIHILEVREAERRWTPDYSSTKFITETWFKRLFADTYAWYRRRYPHAFEASSVRKIKALLLVRGTPFLMEVPASVSSPGRSANTRWVGFPDEVLPEEDAVSWIVSPPDLMGMKPKDVTRLRLAATDIASAARRLSSAVTCIDAPDDIVRGFAREIQLHTETAAVLAAQAGPNGTGTACWEIQMACECAFKALLQRKTGSFPETHDLFRLFDACSPFITGLDRGLLRRIPRSNVVMQLRYGQAPSPSVKAFFRSYRAALTIVPVVVDPLIRMRLGKARFELARLPWLEKVSLNS